MTKTPGQIAYERELEEYPTYENGVRRVSWDELSDIAKWSWERDPTPRLMGRPRSSERLL